MDDIDERLTRDLLESLTTVSRRLRTLFNARVTAHGLTYPRARALIFLLRKPGMTQSELACRMDVEQPTVVRLLDRMEEHNLIRRVHDEDDRRVKKIQLTHEGEVSGELVQSIGEAIRHEVFRDVATEDLEVAISVLNAASLNASEKGS